MAEKRKSSPMEREESPKGDASVLQSIQSERELIVISKSEVGLRATKEGITSVEGEDVTHLTDVLALEGVSIRPLFGVAEERLKHSAASLASKIGVEMPDLSVYYRVDAPDERLDELAGRLRELEIAETAYVKPPAELPQMLNDMVPTAVAPPIVTPDFINRQGYLEAAPGGIDARYAWTKPGGKGGVVSIIDIEGAWRFTHEDLLQNQGGVVGGTQSTMLDWRNHGTAVAGEFGGDWGSFGIAGISPDANVRAISIFGGTGTSGAIRQAADMLNEGDIILIEIHRAGPRFNFQTRRDQRGYIAIEWWPDDFDAIHYATNQGVIVVEAAGNGAENLDDAIYNIRPAGFPTGWTNPFNRAIRDSGAIVVGAGAPPPGTHGNNHGPDRSRLDFSNYGALLDAQGWGREVTTTGYGDLQGGSNEDEWYTDRFSGTSSASPIVVGSIACVQGIMRRHGRFLTPTEVRTLLRATGSHQQDARGRPRTQRIGERPNIREMFDRARELLVISGDGTNDLIVRNGNGELRLYPFLNGTFYGPFGGKRVGNGWNFTHYFVGNWTGDGTDDLIVRTKSRDMLLYPFRNSTFYGQSGGTKVGNGWNFTHYFVGNWTGDGTDDLIVRTKSRDMLLYPFRNNTFYGQSGGTKVGNGWNFTHYFVGNWTGNGTDDLIVRTQNGDMLLYPFRNNTFYGQSGGTKVGNGWNFTHYFVGNWTGNGTDDLIVRTQNGDMLLYPFRNNTFYGQGGGTKVGNGWNFTHYFVGNWAGNGTDDLIVRTKSRDMLLYPFRNNTFYGQGGGTKVGNGFDFTDYLVGNWLK